MRASMSWEGGASPFPSFEALVFFMVVVARPSLEYRWLA
jgi:hypothetical protein